MSNFKLLKDAVENKFARMSKKDLYVVDIDRDVLWATYLASFPAGTNPIFRTRGEFDCNCCKNFIRAIGGVIAVNDGQVESVWDVKVEGFFQEVADAMAALVRTKSIGNVFMRVEGTAGADKNYEFREGGEQVAWNHFFAKIPPKFVVPSKDIGTKLGEKRSVKDVFHRALTTLSNESIDMVLELIAQGSLYRGEEHKFVVEAFRKTKKAYDKLKTNFERDVFCWTSLGLPDSVLRVRNTVIGSLLVDLSEGKDLESAVKSFESKVAPANYKRPTALVTKAMRDKARQTIVELGLENALERRYAFLSDISINNVLFANRSVKQVLSKDPFDVLDAKATDSVKSFDKVEEVGIEQFLTKVLPNAVAIEVMLENRHCSNLVSLIAPVHKDAKNMFKWDNQFSWSYVGEMTDSIKERVKKAGGKVKGDLCCRLAWDYSDDLDFHMKEPDGHEIYFANRRELSRCGGMLDLDANGADGVKEHPAENIYYSTCDKMKEGLYRLLVKNFSRRSDGRGFIVEIEFDGRIITFSTDKVLKSGEIVEVAVIKYSKKDGFSITSSMPSSETSKDAWNLTTQKFHQASVVMLSPNHWDEKAVGNKHYFFMLEGCANDGQARGFFNEYLMEELNVHRKTLEMVGSIMKTDESINQLSGIGFSSTQRNSVLVRVTGSFNRVIRVMF